MKCIKNVSIALKNRQIFFFQILHGTNGFEIDQKVSIASLKYIPNSSALKYLK